MRQVSKLLRVIRHSEAVLSYDLILSYRLAMHAKEIPSLDEYLSLSLGDKPSQDVKAFDEKTDQMLEAQALKRLTERRKQYGQ